MHHPTDRITHTTAFVTPVVEHWLEREMAQWVHSEQAVVAHACHGYRYGPLPVPLSGTRNLISSKCSFYASSHREDSTYHSLSYTSCGVLVGMRNSSVGP